ncbi:MAG: PEP-CTERM sorting domain-containing protein [Pseudomonadota bacterium]
MTNLRKGLALVAAMLLLPLGAQASVIKGDVVDVSGYGDADGSYRLYYVTGTFNEMRRQLRDQIWWNDDAMARDIAGQAGETGINQFGRGLGAFFNVGVENRLFHGTVYSNGSYYSQGVLTYRATSRDARRNDYVWAVVPAPGALVLMGLGLFGLGVARRKA